MSVQATLKYKTIFCGKNILVHIRIFRDWSVHLKLEIGPDMIFEHTFDFGQHASMHSVPMISTLVRSVLIRYEMLPQPNANPLASLETVHDLLEACTADFTHHFNTWGEQHCLA